MRLLLPSALDNKHLRPAQTAGRPGGAAARIELSAIALELREGLADMPSL